MAFCILTVMPIKRYWTEATLCQCVCERENEKEMETLSILVCGVNNNISIMNGYIEILIVS